MGRVRRKRVHKNIKDVKKKFRLRKRTKDLDQIHEDLKTPGVASTSGQLDRKLALIEELDPSLPGGGQFYCTQCARYFIADKAYREHLKSKLHKKRLRLLKETPYTHKEAEMAAGMGSYTVNSKLPSTSSGIPGSGTTENDVDMLVEAMKGTGTESVFAK